MPEPRDDHRRHRRRQVLGAPEAEPRRLFNRVAIAAGRADETRAEALQQQYLQTFGPDDSMSLVMEAMRGRRNEANRLARLIDGRPAGYLAMMMALLRCGCGAPFDLEATPDFAARMTESGLRWPPLEPIHFPSKNW